MDFQVASEMKSLVLDTRSRLLVLAPHPDDESLATGGLLQQAVAQGAAARIVFLTHGENNPWAQRLREKRWRIKAPDRQRWGRLRQEEALRALAALGLLPSCAEFWGFPDQSLTPGLLAGGGEILPRLVDQIERWRPSLLAAPSMLDLHPDHNALGVLMSLALGQIRSPDLRPDGVAYVVHCRDPFPAADGAMSLSLSPQQQATKRRAILSHATQLAFLPGRFLKHAGAQETYLPLAWPAISSAIPLPIRRAAVVDGHLHLDLRPRWHPGAFGPITILLLAVRAGRVQRSLQGRLPLWIGRRFAPLDLWDVLAGASGGQARCRRSHQDIHLELPLSAFGQADNVFCKIKRAHGFFDEAGWQELSLGAVS
jgi:LmbE family N-acetylglucosaminyl deacetylase